MFSHYCIYCTKVYENNTEHVFPSGLGGQDIYMECVCFGCNNSFSELERELYQKSFVGFMRNVEGVKLAKNKHLFFKPKFQFHHDKENAIVYEVGQAKHLEVFIRPQILKINGKFYIESASQDLVKSLYKQLVKWRKFSLLVLTRKPAKKGDSSEFIKFELVQSNYLATEITAQEKPKNAVIIDLLPENNEFYEIFEPRLFIDDSKQLRIRAKSITESIEFMKQFLNYTLTRQRLDVFSKSSKIEQQIVNVGIDFNYKKAERALMKIGLNCLIHYFPQVKSENSLQDYIAFVKDGLPQVNGGFTKEISVLKLKENTHNVFFAQMDDSFNIRVSLFNGNLVYHFSLHGVKILKRKEYNRLLIYYKERINVFESQNDFFQSFGE